MSNFDLTSSTLRIVWIFKLNYLIWIDDHGSLVLLGVTQAQHKVDHIFRE